MVLPRAGVCRWSQHHAPERVRSSAEACRAGVFDLWLWPTGRSAALGRLSDFVGVAGGFWKEPSGFSAGQFVTIQSLDDLLGGR